MLTLFERVLPHSTFTVELLRRFLSLAHQPWSFAVVGCLVFGRAGFFNYPDSELGDGVPQVRTILVVSKGLSLLLLCATMLSRSG